MKPLEGKVAIVTGAAQGLGLEIALELARRGAITILTDIQAEKLGKAGEALAAIDKRSLSLPLDVSSKEQWVEVAETVVKRFGSIDILVNNAGIFTVKPFEEIPEAEWDRVFAVNVKGVLFGCQAVSPVMRRQKSGRVISLASQAGKTGGLLVGAHYSASKAAVICMTKSFAAALAPDNITVNAVAPGMIKTDFLQGVPGIENLFSRIPIGKGPGEASDVAKAVAFLASEDARYITGEILDVNGGLLMD
jgi:NAD(P)-dependent dehydrogenase (short-subunit alcohol dehydrogenase family)